ncbi:DUF6311 domain-containing protein [Sphingomonas immobilis]|uniref:DUF6311 domain-containing protein n=1 Tax=Sphingomonas immobilis TaxID=3063997 RepID=A0ABT8ZYX1_9SPHN|nr:DUF6311 domain-containing protein [Sphingomonas sp. CA1-15]MDO7841971.1 DUF6311 domain-containing protein [Sphingomonas sp. CA1-15]
MRPLHRSPIDMAVIALLAALLFVAFFNVAMLDPTNIGWLLRGTDNAENALGVHAWLADPAAHGFRTHLLGAPEGVSLLFTDSNPLLALVVAPVARDVGGDLQFVGPWFLACLILHLVLARALLAPYAKTPLALWCGVLLLTLLPTLYVRQVHANLCAHWLILWALWVYVDPRRAGDWRWWLAVLGVAAAMHSYLLVMVAAIWGSAMLERFVAAPDWRRRAGLALGAAGALCLVAAILAMLVDRGAILSSGTYGRFGMPVDAVWNPALQGLSAFLPAHAQAADRQMEAFQYLGAGLLLLIVATPLILWRSAPAPAIAALHRRLLWLVPALVVLTLLAISHRVDFAGRTLFTLPLSQAGLALLDPVRASSRLFWPVAYVLVFVAITAAYRLSSRRAALVLAGALALQVVDMIPLSAMMRHDAAIAGDRDKWKRTRDPRWTAAIAAARDVTFMPPDATEQLDLFQEVAWRAVDARKPVRLVYQARTSAETARRLAQEQRDFEAGRLDPHRLYVLLPDARVPAAAQGRVATLDGVRVILPL